MSEAHSNPRSYHSLPHDYYGHRQHEESRHGMSRHHGQRMGPNSETAMSDIGSNSGFHQYGYNQNVVCPWLV